MQTCNMSVGDVCALLTSRAVLWRKDPHGPIIQARLAYWRDALGFSLSDLSHAPHYLSLAVPVVACRLSLLSKLGIQVASPAAAAHLLQPESQEVFARRALVTAVCIKDAGANVQSALRPLGSDLLQSESNRQRWERLLSLPGMQMLHARERGVSDAQKALYSALWHVYRDDWRLTAPGREVVALDVVAKEADAVQNSAARRAHAPSFASAQDASRVVRQLPRHSRTDAIADL